jgi:hypothetical protein
MIQAVADDDWWSTAVYHPILQSGVQWVNEKVTIQNGDTSSYYYTYEMEIGETTIRQNQPVSAWLCYYFTDNRNGKDSIIATLRPLIDDGLIYTIKNNAADKICEENRNMLDRWYWYFMDIYYGLEELYHFYSGFPDGEGFRNNIIIRQLEPSVLNFDNFLLIDSINIENEPYARFAYINEQGDTMCYVIEGCVGFDSKCMGDLLTPFTRIPDPNADYQEYCGLSHVIKDGKIIYKGMRYREDQYTGIGDVAADQRHPQDGNYYDLMGRVVGKDVPTMPGIYIHNGKKIVVR